MKHLAILMAAAFVLAGCSGEKSSEPKVEGSVNIDLSKEKEKIGSALEKAGEEVKKGATEAKEKLQDAGEALKKNVEAAKDKLTEEKKADGKVEVKTK